MKVKIGPHKYDVVVQANAIMPEDYGRCFVPQQQIWINEEQATTSASETLLHETLHALFALTGLDKDLEDEQEETVIRRLAPALLAMLRDNPKLVKTLLL